MLPVAGYLFRNAQYRLELQRSIDEADGGALPSRPEAADASEMAYAGWDGFAEGSQTKHVQVLPVGLLLMFPLYGSCLDMLFSWLDLPIQYFLLTCREMFCAGMRSTGPHRCQQQSTLLCWRRSSQLSESRCACCLEPLCKL